MTWLGVTEYLYHKWPLIGFVCRNHNQVLSSNMIYYRICSNSTTTGDTCRTGYAYYYGAHEFDSGFGGFLLLGLFCVMFCKSWFFPLSFFICHCVVCPSSIYGFWLRPCYLQTFLAHYCLKSILSIILINSNQSIKTK